MQLIHQAPEKLAVRMNANESLANAIRRSVNEVPVLAIDEVEIFKNDSALYDEFLTHRIGLVPLKTEASMNEKSEHTLKLVKVGPCEVFARDFEGNAEVVYPDIPLTLLEKGQELELIATARLGQGIDHEKYTPGLCYYRHLMMVNSKNPHVQRLIEQNKGIFAPEKVKDGWLCDLPEGVIQQIEELEASAIKPSPELILIIESFGQMAAKDIFLKALKALGENVNLFRKALS